MRRTLLDTHALLWVGQGDSQLSPAAKSVVEDEEADLLVSLVSLWEIAIKSNLGKLNLLMPVGRFVDERVRQAGYSLLPIQVDHLERVEALPLHHRDPFDRLLVAQALVENVPILSADPALDAYGVQRVW